MNVFYMDLFSLSSFCFYDKIKTAVPCVNRFRQGANTRKDCHQTIAMDLLKRKKSFQGRTVFENGNPTGNETPAKNKTSSKNETPSKNETSPEKGTLLKKQDLFLAAVLLFLALSALLARNFMTGPPAVTAQISVDGAVTNTLDLAKDQEITVTSKNGGSNTLVIQNGEIWCSQASCPDQICVHQGKKQRDGDTIVCLPNQMIVTIIGEGE